MKCLRQRKAFTIVEMVIVIAVIAILATVLVPTIAGVIQKANHSADTQFAASLNVQLALWQVDHGEISSESDLRDAINEYYGEWEYDAEGNKTKLTADGDFYATLTPKSGKQGYHYWWNATDKQVVLASYEELAKEDDGTSGQAEADEPTFSPASPRSLMIETDEGWKNYFLMDQAGSDLADVIASETGFEQLPDDTEYALLIDHLVELSVDEDNEEHELFNAILEKVKVTTIVTDGGAFRYDGEQIIQYVWISPKATVLKQTSVYYYDETKGTPNALAGATIMDIELPSGVSVGVEGLKAPATEANPGNAYENTTRLHVNTTEVTELLKVYTDCVLVMSDGSKYIWQGENLYPLPLKVDASGKPTGSVGSVDEETMGDIGEFGLTCEEVADTAGQGKAFMNNGILYVAYDKGTVRLTLTGGVTNGMVTWSSGDENLATVDSGVVTLKLPAVGATYSVDITATYKYDTDKTATMTVYIVRPNSANVSVGTDSVEVYTDEDKGSIDISYANGDDLLHPITLTEVTNNDGSYVTYVTGETSSNPGFVAVDKGTLTYEYSGNLFTVKDHVLTLNKDVIEGRKSQDLTIIYSDAKGVEYFRKTFTVTVEDNSAVGLKKNNITSTVTMGDYLFRVGNANTFTLGKLFSPVEEGKAVVVMGVNIYNASKTEEDGTRYEIATSGTGFHATCNLDTSNWKNSTIQFGGTGVAIIEVVTSAGKVELAVEVMEAKNVTSAGDFSGATNYVLLNDITWGSSKDVAISGTIYGNGFAINAPSYNPAVSGNTAMFALKGGTIDNLVINGPVYPEVSYSGGNYYVAGIYATGDAKITNSYISGFRQPIMANGSSLYLENTTLVGGNYGNLWLQTGTLTLKDVTTVQKTTAATVGSGNVLGMGIVASEGINASNVTVQGNLTQYNWASQADTNNMDSDIKSLASTIFSNNTTITHTVNDTQYINTGILFLGQDGTVNNASQTNKANYQTVTASGKFMGVSVEANVYTYATTNGAITSVPTYAGYTPNKQAVLAPTFKDNLTKTDGKVVYSIDIPNGATATLDASGYTVSKYSGQSIAVNITCPGATIDGKKITFTKAGTYTLTYTVEDNAFFNADGSKQIANNVDTYTVSVVVSNSNHPTAVIDVSGVDKTIYMVLSNTKSDTDYAAYFAILKGLKITDYDAGGNASSVSISAGTMPSGLIVTASNSEFTSQKTKDSVLYLGDSKANNNNDYSSITITYKYTGNNGKTASATVTYTGFTKYETLEDNRSTGCFTPDTLITLADGTQKEIQHVSNEDMLLVWDFYTGQYSTVPAAVLINHGMDEYTIITLKFDDGTEVKVVEGHEFFNADANKWAFIDENNVANYIGTNFIRANGDSYATVKLVDYSVHNEVTEAYSIFTAVYYNCFAENMLSLTPSMFGSTNYYVPFEIGEELKYDEEAMQADIEKYGLYTYEDFSDYVTYEQFVGFNAAYFKVSVGKGLVTYEQLIQSIFEYVNVE